MKSGQVFWGVFLLAIGLLLLLDNLNILCPDWEFIPKLWPVILILWGVAALVTTKQLKWVFTALIALLLALLAYWFFSFHWFHRTFEVMDDGRATTQTFMESFEPGTDQASLRVKTGAADIRFEGTTDQLLEARTRTSFGRYNLDKEQSGDETHLELSLNDGKSRWRLGRLRNSVDLRLNPAPLWDLNFEVGAVSADLDASGLKTRSVRVDGGASSVRLRLGDRADRCDVEVRTGVSSVRIDVPAEAGCEIRVKAPLSAKSFRDFEETRDHVYETENFDRASKKIYINFDVGVSSLKVRRY